MTPMAARVTTPAVAGCASLRYLALLAGLLLREADELAELGAVDAGLPARLEASCHDAASGPFDQAVAAYAQARDLVAAALDERYTLAQAYWSMDEFWADAASQERGESISTYWDSYEHGLRRRLERLLANAYGSDNAVLTNTGMSALDVALRALHLPHGARLLVHHRAYFETSEYLREVLAPSCVEVIAADLTDAREIAVALRTRQPDAVLVETVLNGPSCDLVRVDQLLGSGLPVVLDNSTLGHAVPGHLLAGRRIPALVVESGAKYLTREASFGVLYGWGELIGEARLTARRTGQQLTGRALHHLRAGEISSCARRMELHAARARLFREVLVERSPCPLVVTAADRMTAGRRDQLAEHVAAGNIGCLLYVRLLAPDPIAERLHRECVARWQQLASGPRVRAGFGWTRTSARSYGKDALNTLAGQPFIRISVGIEPEEEIRDLAEAFARATQSCLTEKGITG